MLTTELTVYEKQADAFRKHVHANPDDLNADYLWQWWCQQRAQLPAWFSVARILYLILPASAVMERFFSVLKLQTSTSRTPSTKTRSQAASERFLTLSKALGRALQSS
jgi:hypothetical protein